MISKDSAHENLRRLCRRYRIVDIETLFDALETGSRMSVFRRLCEVGYLTSYTHRGSYYTLSEIPVFDEHGLWFHQGVGFSRAGTLKQAVAEEVLSSDAGCTHRELELLLRVRVHNQLLELVRETRIGRKLLVGCHLYVSGEKERGLQQLAQRKLLDSKQPQALGPLSDEATIEVLVEVLHSDEVLVTPGEVTGRLRARGTQLRVEQVEQVYARYGLGGEKKTSE